MNILFSTESTFTSHFPSAEEYLFLNPDGVRTQFPIGWEGQGRYVKGSLRLYDANNVLIDRSTYHEMDNRIFFEFNTPPAAGSYTDIIVRYLVDPEDYAFSHGTADSAYPGEEYFLFPNWNNAKGCGDAFWVGKYAASNDGNNVPVSMKGKSSWVKTEFSVLMESCSNKGSEFHCIRNREWVSIALWTEIMNLSIYGNVNGKNTPNDMDMRDIGTAITDDIVDTTDTNKKILTGTGPDTFRHNGSLNGISDLIGNVWELVDGIKLIDGVPYVFNDDNTDYVALSVDDIDPFTNLFSSNKILYINNSTNDLLNEGLPVLTGGMPIREDDYLFKYNTGTRICCRGGDCHNGVNAGIWTINLNGASAFKSWGCGTRISKDL